MSGALNSDFERYDQVRKAHSYRLAEHESDSFDEDYEIATLDFAPNSVNPATTTA